MRSLSSIGVTAPTSDKFTIKRPDRHTVSAALLYHVRNIVIEEDVSGTNQIGPLVQVVAIGIEDLNAVIFSVTDVNLVVFIDSDFMENRELSGSFPGLTPREFEIAVGTKTVNATVTVSVRDK